MLSRHADLGQKADLFAVGCHTTMPGDMEQGQEEQTGNMTGALGVGTESDCVRLFMMSSENQMGSLGLDKESALIWRKHLEAWGVLVEQEGQTLTEGPLSYTLSCQRAGAVGQLQASDMSLSIVTG